MTAGGVELPPFDPRVQPGLGLMYAAAPTGPRYDAVEHDLDFDPEQGCRTARRGPPARAHGAGAGVHSGRRSHRPAGRTVERPGRPAGLPVREHAHPAVEPGPGGALVGAVTGRVLTPADVFALGRERFARQHEINDRLGVAAGTLPDRFFTEPVRTGVHRGAVLDRAQFDTALAVLRQRWREPARTEGSSP